MNYYKLYRFSYAVSIFLIFIALAVGNLSVDAKAAWYSSLQRPFFSPPSWLFGFVWSILYILLLPVIAYFVRSWQRFSLSMQLLLGLHYIAHILWTPLFFRYHLILIAFGALIFLTATSWAIFCCALPRLYKILFMPYCAWLSFAMILNGALYLLN